MASGMFMSAKKGLFDRATVSIDYDTDALKVLLVVSDIASNLNTWDFRDDVNVECPATGGYTTGGVSLASVTVTASGGVVTFDAADTSYAALTQAAIRGSVIYKNVGTAATDPLSLYHDHGAQSITAGTYTVQWNAGGIATLT